MRWQDEFPQEITDRISITKRGWWIFSEHHVEVDGVHYGYTFFKFLANRTARILCQGLYEEMEFQVESERSARRIQRSRRNQERETSSVRLLRLDDNATVDHNRNAFDNFTRAQAKHTMIDIRLPGAEVALIERLSEQFKNFKNISHVYGHMNSWSRDFSAGIDEKRWDLHSINHYICLFARVQRHCTHELDNWKIWVELAFEPGGKRVCTYQETIYRQATKKSDVTKWCDDAMLKVFKRSNIRVHGAYNTPINPETGDDSKERMILSLIKD